MLKGHEQKSGYSIGLFKSSIQRAKDVCAAKVLPDRRASREVEDREYAIVPSFSLLSEMKTHFRLANRSFILANEHALQAFNIVHVHFQK